jgi:SAM-dependent methyltransferase
MGQITEKQGGCVPCARQVRIKGHAEAQFSSDAEAFYKDYWISGETISPQSLELRKSLLQTIFPNGIFNRFIAELGVGGEGGYIALLQKENATIGFDASQTAIELCSKIGLDVQHQNLDKDALPLKEGSVDLVIAMEVFEHFASPQFVLEQIQRILSSHGEVIISTPNPRIYHWPRLFYPELFQMDAFQDFLMANNFQVVRKIGALELPLKLPQGWDRAWHWIWHCKKLDRQNPSHLFEFGCHFFNQTDSDGYRRKPIESIDFFRSSLKLDPQVAKYRLYLARALLYRFISGESEEFRNHFDFLIHLIEHGCEDEKKEALYHFLMVYFDLEKLGCQQIPKSTFDAALKKLAELPGKGAYWDEIQKKMAQFIPAAVSAGAMPQVPADHIAQENGPGGNRTGQPTNKIYLGIHGYKNSGWGVCSQNLSKELAGLVDLLILKEEDDTACNANLDGLLFQ